jgi:hypothetical protein
MSTNTTNQKKPIKTLRAEVIQNDSSVSFNFATTRFEPKVLVKNSMNKFLAYEGKMRENKSSNWYKYKQAFDLRVWEESKLLFDSTWEQYNELRPLLNIYKKSGSRGQLFRSIREYFKNLECEEKK